MFRKDPVFERNTLLPIIDNGGKRLFLDDAVELLNGVSDMENDEPKECIEKDVVGVVSLTELLRDLTLIKKYSFETYDERIYLCADNIEQKLNKLRYANFIFDKDW